ncbi:---NA---, partial [Paramuricea clavata]
MFGNIHMVFTLLSLNWGLVAIVYGGLVELPDHEYNDTHDEAVVAISARAKFNGTNSKSNSVPMKSRVTLYCRVWLDKSQEHLFNLMLVSFTLPNGEHVVPGSCTVDIKHTKSCKRCKIVMKNVALSDQGKYRCHAQYLTGTNMMEKYEEIFLYVKKDWCPSFKVFCNFSKTCVASFQECKEKFPPLEQHIHQLTVKSYNEVRNVTPTQLYISKKKPMVLSAVLPLSITVIMFIILLILGAVILW